VFVLAWNAYGEIAFARASHDYANNALAAVPRPLDWIDRNVPDGAQVDYIGQSLRDANSVLQLEFWNRSFRHVWTTDGTILGSARPRVPDVLSPDGRLQLDDEDVRYVLADHGIVPVGRLLASKTYAEGTLSRWKLYRITPPLRVRQTVEGIYGDDWGREHTALNQFSLPPDVPSTLSVRVTRTGAGSPLPADVVVRVGRLAVAPGYVQGLPVPRAVMGKVFVTKRLHVARNLDHVFEFKAPSVPFRVETSVTPLPPPPPGFTLTANDRPGLAAQIYYRVTSS